MLPFNNNNDRKFCCFCCAMMFTTYEEYKNHILEKHEEGRDYVLCPLSFCKAPVRDQKAHAAAKHPGIPLKYTGMTKAIIWKDFSGGKKKTRKPKFREGFYESTKMHKKFHYRSSWEATMYELLDSWNEVISYDCEPIKIKYIHKGQCRDYIPDLIIKFKSGKTQIAEIKPSNQTLLEINKDKWSAAESACKLRGMEFFVYTEQEIQKLKQKVKLQQLNE